MLVKASLGWVSLLTMIRRERLLQSPREPFFAPLRRPGATILDSAHQVTVRCTTGYGADRGRA